jgi:ribonuclease VapC
VRLVVDASAILAILLGEPDGAFYLTTLKAADEVWISPVNWWEVEVRLLGAMGNASASKAVEWVRDLGISVEPISIAHAKLAAAAFARYRGSPARLNLGDCFAYALAQEKRVALLYKGNDFAQTDVERHSI